MILMLAHDALAQISNTFCFPFLMCKLSIFQFLTCFLILVLFSKKHVWGLQLQYEWPGLVIRSVIVVQSILWICNVCSTFGLLGINAVSVWPCNFFSSSVHIWFRKVPIYRDCSVFILCIEFLYIMLFCVSSGPRGLVDRWLAIMSSTFTLTLSFSELPVLSVSLHHAFLPKSLFSVLDISLFL